MRKLSGFEDLFMQSIHHNLSIRKDLESALTRKLGRNVKIESADFIGGGCINHASKIETNAGTFFLKWNENCPPDIFLREAECLEELTTTILRNQTQPKTEKESHNENTNTNANTTHSAR